MATSDPVGPVVWMLATHDVEAPDGYGVRVRSETAALMEHGIQVRLIQVLPIRAYLRQLRTSVSWQRVVVPQPPDLGVPLLRSMQNAWLRLVIRVCCWLLRVRRIHAQGLRAGSLCSNLPPSVHVVIDVHGDVVAETLLVHSERNHPRVRAAMRDSLRAFNRADSLVYVSPGMAAWLAAEAVATPRRYEVRCAVDPQRFSGGAPVPRSARAVIAYCGGAQPYQPPELVVATMASLAALKPESAFLIVTPTANHRRYEAVLRRAGLDAELVAATEAEVPALLAMADIGIIPRVADQVNAVACPTKIAEYLAAGVPVLCCEGVGGFLPELEADGVGLRLEAEAGALSRFIQDVISHRPEFSHRCRSVAAASWSWDAAMPALAAADYLASPRQEHPGRLRRAVAEERFAGLSKLHYGKR